MISPDSFIMFVTLVQLMGRKKPEILDDLTTIVVVRSVRSARRISRWWPDICYELKQSQ